MASVSQPAADTAPVSTCGSCPASRRADGKPLDHCGKCKIQQYCSKECQVKDWPSHKVQCKKEKKGEPLSARGLFSGTGVLITPFRSADSNSEIGYSSMPYPTVDQLLLERPGWIDSAIAEALGVPLRMFGVPHGDVTIPNEHAAALAMNPDPDSAFFGQTHSTTTITGSALVLRSDLKKLHMNQVAILIAYVRDEIEEVHQVKDKEAKGEKVDRKEIAGRLLTPAAFSAYFEKEKAAQMAATPANRVGVWKECETPVAIPQGEAGE